MRLTRYGISTWGPLTIIVLVIAAVLAWLQWWWTLPVLALFWIAVAMFFRDPGRELPGDLAPGDMISPADGVVSAVLTVDEHEATGGPARIVRIFLSVLDVHVNRSPCDGTVLAVRHRRGHYYDARTEESARLNESKLITLAIAGDETMGVRQVTGKVARHIICGVGAGDAVRRGERFGMIKFGSTAEVILPRPDDVDVAVRVGDRVHAGVTVVATLRPKPTTVAADAPAVATAANE